MSESWTLEAALRDRGRYHPSDPSMYRGTIGVPFVGGDGELLYTCPGCWWCCPPLDAGDEVYQALKAEGWPLGRREVEGLGG